MVRTDSAPTAPRPLARGFRWLAAALLAAAVSSVALAGKVTGRVTDAAGAPLAGVSVTLVPEDEKRMSRQTLKTNKDGRYVFGIVPDGTFRIEVAFEELIPSTIRLTVFDLAQKKNVVDYSGPAPTTPQSFPMNVNTNATYDFVLIPRSQTPQAIAEERQKQLGELPTLLGEGKFQEARPRLEDLLKARPDSPELHYFYAFTLFKLNELDAARAEAEKTLQLRADQPGAHFVLGEILLAQQKKDEALPQLEAEVANPATDDKTRQRALVSAAELHRESGHVEAAIAGFERVVQADPKMAEAWNSLAELYLRTGQHDKAAAAQEKARATGQEDPVTVFNLGAESWNRKDYSKAAEYFRHATELDPNFAMAWKNLGYAYVNLGQTEEAAKALRKYLELSPSAEDAGEIRQMLGAIAKS